MRTPEEILTNVYGCLTWGETVRDFLTEVSPTILTDAIKLAQREAWNEAIELSIQKVGRDSFVKEQLLKLKK